MGPQAAGDMLDLVASRTPRDNYAGGDDVTVAADRWTKRRERAAELAERWPFATAVLRFYGDVLGAQARVYEAAQADLVPVHSTRSAVDTSRIVSYVVEQALPRVKAVTATGPERLARAVAADAPARDWDPAVRVWLSGGDLPAVDRFLVRAAAGPVLEALGQMAGDACAGSPRDERHCPQCGGLPQLSVFVATGEDLVAPRRYLECARCAWRWSYPRMTCAACGENDSGRQPIFAEEGTTQAEATGSVIRGTGEPTTSATGPGTPRAGAPRFPHLSIHACGSCSKYLLNVDLTRDARAVPVVDEVAAIPLDLYAREHGLVKIVPNLMGF